MGFLLQKSDQKPLGILKPAGPLGLNRLGQGLPRVLGPEFFRPECAWKFFTPRHSGLPPLRKGRKGSLFVMVPDNRKGEMLAAAAYKRRYWPTPQGPRLTLDIIQGENHLFGWIADSAELIAALAPIPR